MHGSDARGHAKCEDAESVKPWSLVGVHLVGSVSSSTGRSSSDNDALSSTQRLEHYSTVRLGPRTNAQQTHGDRARSKPDFVSSQNHADVAR